MSGRCGVVVGHGRVAEGLLSALTRVAGEQPDLWAVSNEGRTGEDLVTEILTLLEERCLGRDAYLLSDLDGGSCGQACRRLLEEGRVRGVFYGVNLPLLVEFVFLPELPVEQFVTAALEKSRKALGARR